MATESAADYRAILRTVISWPAEDRFALVQDVLRTLAPRPEPDFARRAAALDRLRGIAKTDRPPPSDEEVKQWLEEERVKKYG